MRILIFWDKIFMITGGHSGGSKTASHFVFYVPNSKELAIFFGILFRQSRIIRNRFWCIPRERFGFCWCLNEGHFKVTKYRSWRNSHTKEERPNEFSFHWVKTPCRKNMICFPEGAMGEGVAHSAMHRHKRIVSDTSCTPQHAPPQLDMFPAHQVTLCVYYEL